MRAICGFFIGAALALASPAIARDHFDADSGYKLDPVAPVYYYVSACPSGTPCDQYNLTLGTNTTLTVPTGATSAAICLVGSGATANYTIDGQTASPTVGLPVAADSTGKFCFTYTGPIAAMKWTGTGALYVQYLRNN